MSSASRAVVLVTGAAGFIGFHLSKRLLDAGVTVVGIDNLNDYYSIGLKRARLAQLEPYEGFAFQQADLADEAAINAVFSSWRIDVVVNLAAQAGVRYSITNPSAYISSNIVGFHNVLEACRHYPVRHLVYASSSSVYGLNATVPYSTEDRADRPVSLYAATKRSNELMAHAYSKLYGIPVTGLRFFTVYGPMGRPDMAYFSFTEKLIRGETIQIFNNGHMRRDFTYVDDIVTGVVNVMEQPPVENQDGVRSALYNIGNSHPEDLLCFVEILEDCLMQEGLIQERGKREFLPMQPGDVIETYADVSPLEETFGFKPNTPLKTGLARFARWYKEFCFASTST